MTRYHVTTLIDCGIDIVVDAPDENTARKAAYWATADHVSEVCDGIAIDHIGPAEGCPEAQYGVPVEINPDGSFQWSDTLD
jgi:hypothetical protein